MTIPTVSVYTEPVRFLAAPMGLAECDFNLFHVENGLYALRAANDSVRLFIVHGSLLPSYAPVIGDEEAATLGLTSGEDAEVYVVVNPAGTEPVVNLVAPIVVNRVTREALQVIIDDDALSVRAPLGALLAA
ncbi:flagellar assembly protein FliW [Gryllotalpicola sp.]|uniref:flagellar assembly protein FliW n=1 Tax=Gryllotalpicola sp. TaxID=1932787 RepID=UPI00261D6C3C|nr:flagellar assembly protein FliW [Gryllotalpicola sp.]